MLLRKSMVTEEWIEKHNPKIVKAAPAGMDNIMADEGRMSIGDHEEFQAERAGWGSEMISVEYGSDAEIEYRKIRRQRAGK